MPTITRVVLASNTAITPNGLNAIHTDGNVSMIIRGSNFGPSVRPLVQWVRVTSPVAQYAVRSYTVLNDTALNVTVAPGVGKNLSFTVRVAEQDSPITPVTFDYLSPVVLGMLPPNGPTASVNGFPVVIVGRNFGLSAGATVVVQIGNTEDSTVSALLPAQPVFPPGDDGTPKIRVNESVQFQLPPGVGTGRAVRVIVYPSVYNNLAVSSNPSSDGAGSLFNYDPPAVALVVASVLDLNSTFDVVTAQTLLGPVSLYPCVCLYKPLVGVDLVCASDAC